MLPVFLNHVPTLWQAANLPSAPGAAPFPSASLSASSVHTSHALHLPPLDPHLVFSDNLYIPADGCGIRPLLPSTLPHPERGPHSFYTGCSTPAESLSVSHPRESLCHSILFSLHPTFHPLFTAKPPKKRSPHPPPQLPHLPQSSNC